MIKKLFFIFTFIAMAAKGFAEENIEDVFSSPPDQIITPKESSDFLIGGIIHPLSGQPCLHQTDLVAKGAQSLELKRTFIPFYTPLNEREGKIHPSKSSYAGWVYFPHTHLNVFKQIKAKGQKIKTTETIVSVSDPHGTVLTYEINRHGHTKLKSKCWGICNGINDNPSGLYDPRNTSISIDKTNVSLETPDGTKRLYYCSNYYELNLDRDSYTCLYCLLEKEILPNGKVIRYTYDKDRQVVKVESMDPKESHVYATLDINSPLKETEGICSTNTGLQATYTHETASYFKKDKQEKYVDLIYPLRFTAVNSPSFTNETINYHTTSNGDSYLTEYSGKHPIFKCASIIVSGKKKKEKKPHAAVELSFPSEGTTFSPVYFMDYLQGIPGEENSITTVTHSDGIKKVYTFNPKMLPEKICDYDQLGNLIKEKNFTWTTNQWLQSVKIKDGKQQLLSEKTFQYDSFGNPVCETFTGDLRGRGEIENNEIHRTFSNDRRNLLLSETHSNGKVVAYSYLPETNLMTSCLIKDNGKHCLSREFRRYDGCYNLIQVINDDGSSDQADNLTDVTERKIVCYHLRQQQPFLHMPEQIEVKYLENGVEKLLKRTALVYDQWGNVAHEHVYDAEGQFAYTLQKEYDQQGNVLSETNPLGQKAQYSYDTFGRKITSLNFANTIETFNDYDAKGRLIKSQEITTEGIVRNYFLTYDQKNRLVKKTDSYNHTTTYAYDLIANQPIQINKPTIYHTDGKACVVTEKAGYDPLGKKLFSIDPNGNMISYHYNAFGSPTIISYPDNSKETFCYDHNGQLVNHCLKNGLIIVNNNDILGNVTRKSYVFSGKVIGQEFFDFKGSKLIKSHDLEGNITNYDYDGLGRKIREEKLGSITTYQYDSLGELSLVCNENGEKSLYTHFKYDLLGRVLEKKKTNANGDILIKIAYSYDANGNNQTITKNINGQEAVETFLYDAYNRLVSYVNAQGNATTTSYDETSLNRFGQQILTKITKDSLGRLSIDTHDPYERIVKQEKLNAALQTLSSKEIDYDACGNQVMHHEHVYQGTDYLSTRLVKWTYDTCHRTQSITRGFNTPEARTTKWSYFQSGKPWYKTQPDGTVLTFDYDAFEHLTSVRCKDRLNHHFTYNKLGHLLTASDELNDIKIRREVDGHGNVLVEELPNGLQVKKQHDHLNRVVSMTLPDGSGIVYHYDPLFLKKVERVSSSGKTLYEHVYENYDESGYLLTEGLIADLGLINHKTDSKGQAIGVTSDYFKQECQYDVVGNLIKQIFNDVNEETLAYDDLSQLSIEPGYAYQFDSIHNRLKENGNQFQYNALNELLSREDASFIYDLRGNLVKKSKDNQNLKLSYDSLDRLVEVEADEKKIRFGYDALGRKLCKTLEVDGNEKTDWFFYDGKNEIGITTEKGEIKQLSVLGLGSHPEKRNIVAVELGGKAYAPLLDIQGNVRGLIDTTTKTSVANYNYTAFGKQLPSPNRVFNPWQYGSKRYDPDLGLIDFGKRHYDPQLGRWLTTDPAGFVDSFNLYQFNLNNPFRYYDPNGEFIFVPLLCGAFGFGFAATAVTVEIVAAEVIIGTVVTGAALWGISEGLSAIDHAVNSRRFAPYYQGSTETETKEEKKTKGKRHSPDQEALCDLAKRAGKGVTNEQADTLLEWADEYGFPARDDRGLDHWEGGEHIRIGRQHHLPIIFL